MPPVTQATASGMGQIEGDMADGSSEVMVLGEESASIPLTPSIDGGSVPAGTSRRDRSVAVGANWEPSLSQTSVGSDSPARGKHLLRWASLEDPTSTLFTLDDTVESMEWESLDMGITFVLEALDHVRGALRDVVVPSGRVFA